VTACGKPLWKCKTVAKFGLSPICPYIFANLSKMQNRVLLEGKVIDRLLLSDHMRVRVKVYKHARCVSFHSPVSLLTMTMFLFGQLSLNKVRKLPFTLCERRTESDNPCVFCLEIVGTISSYDDVRSSSFLYFSWL
jgi:hypothetical protein